MSKARISTSGGATVVEHCTVADRVLTRMRGLMGRSGLDEGEGILLSPAPSIHTFFMRFPIDVVFMDGDFRVLRVVTDMRPWRAAMCRGARSALELPAREADRRGIAAGDMLAVEVAA